MQPNDAVKTTACVVQLAVHILRGWFASLAGSGNPSERAGVRGQVPSLDCHCEFCPEDIEFYSGRKLKGIGHETRLCGYSCRSRDGGARCGCMDIVHADPREKF